MKKHNIKKVENPTSPIDKASVECYNTLTDTLANHIRLAVLSGAAETFSIFATTVAEQEGNTNSATFLTLCTVVNGFFLLFNIYKSWIIGKERKCIKELYELKKEIEDICKDELGMSDEEFAQIEQSACEESEDEMYY